MIDTNKIAKSFVKKVLDASAKQMEQLVKKNIGVDTGQLRGSIHTERISDKVSIVSHDPNITEIAKTYSYPQGKVSDYGSILELGRGAIDMKKKGLNYPLHWEKNGKDIYAWRVKAVKPRKFYIKSLEEFDINKINI